MADQLAETLTLDALGATATLYRDVKFMQESRTIDHMIVDEPATGDRADVVIIHEGDKQSAKRWVRHLEIKGTTPAVPATSAVSYSFADLDAETEKRILQIYRMFTKRLSPSPGGKKSVGS